MKVFTCTDHEGHWVGVASVVVADTQEEAEGLLREALARHGLTSPRPFTLTEIDTTKTQAVVLQDGDY